MLVAAQLEPAGSRVRAPLLRLVNKCIASHPRGVEPVIAVAWGAQLGVQWAIPILLKMLKEEGGEEEDQDREAAAGAPHRRDAVAEILACLGLCCVLPAGKAVVSGGKGQASWVRLS